MPKEKGVIWWHSTLLPISGKTLFRSIFLASGHLIDLQQHINIQMELFLLLRCFVGIRSKLIT